MFEKIRALVTSALDLLVAGEPAPIKIYRDRVEDTICLSCVPYAGTMSGYYSGYLNRILDDGVFAKQYNLESTCSIASAEENSENSALTAELRQHLSAVAERGTQLMRDNSKFLQGKDDFPLYFYYELRNAFVEAHIRSEVVKPVATEAEKKGYFAAAKVKIDSAFTGLEARLAQIRENFDSRQAGEELAASVRAIVNPTPHPGPISEAIAVQPRNGWSRSPVGNNN